MIYPAAKLDDYLAANHAAHLRPEGPIKLSGLGDGTTKLDEWPEELGKPPTPEEVAAWTPTPPDPDKAPAPSLEIRDYKALDAALESATTVLALRGVFRQYLRRRAGL